MMHQELTVSHIEREIICNLDKAKIEYACSNNESKSKSLVLLTSAQNRMKRNRLAPTFLSGSSTPYDAIKILLKKMVIVSVF